jgi:hypothetical protein
MEDVGAYVRENWSAEGAEVLSTGRSSLTVGLPYEFRQVDDALEELCTLHDVSVDLQLTDTGANLRIRSGRTTRRTTHPQRDQGLAQLPARISHTAQYTKLWASALMVIVITITLMMMRGLPTAPTAEQS